MIGPADYWSVASLTVASCCLCCLYLPTVKRLGMKVYVKNCQIDNRLNKCEYRQNNIIGQTDYWSAYVSQSH